MVVLIDRQNHSQTVVQDFSSFISINLERQNRGHPWPCGQHLEPPQKAGQSLELPNDPEPGGARVKHHPEEGGDGFYLPNPHSNCYCWDHELVALRYELEGGGGGGGQGGDLPLVFG